MKASEENERAAPDQGINIPKRRRMSKVRPLPLKWLIGLLLIVLALMWLLNRV